MQTATLYCTGGDSYRENADYYEFTAQPESRTCGEVTPPLPLTGTTPKHTTLHPYRGLVVPCLSVER